MTVPALLRRIWASGRPSRQLPTGWRRVHAATAGLDGLVREPPAVEGAPVLVLLHGSGHSPAVFLPGAALGGSIPRDYPALVLMPDGRRSWYLDSAEARWEESFVRLLRWVEQRYPVYNGRHGWGICGFSMGGFGAMRLAARYPDLFGSASSILGLLDIAPLWPEHPALSRLLGGQSDAWDRVNPAALVSALGGTRLLVSTGAEAFDRRLNEVFVARCHNAGVPVEYEVLPGGHDVDLVAEALPRHLRFHADAFGLPDKGGAATHQEMEPVTGSVPSSRKGPAGGFARNPSPVAHPP